MMRYVLVISLLTGCVSYHGAPIDTSRPAHSRLEKTEQRGLVIAVEDYSSPSKSQKYFGQSLADLGYLPLLISISNTGDAEFVLRVREILFSYENGTQALVAEVDDVIEKAGFSHARALLSLPLIFPIPFIWKSVSEANAALDHDYRKKALRNLEITKGERIFGILFVEVPESERGEPVGEGIVEMAVFKKGTPGKLAEMLLFSVPVADK